LCSKPFGEELGVTPRSASGATSNHEAAATIEARKLSTIGDLAREFGVSLRTIRFYEDRGLLSPKRDGSARYYDPHEKARLSLILKGKQLGFTLGEIRDLIKDGGGTPPTALSLKPDQIASQISHLERQRNEIDDAILELREAHRRLSSGP
jgi:DNA-binding transcriptional MerR regulator